MKKMLIYRY